MICNAKPPKVLKDLGLTTCVKDKAHDGPVHADEEGREWVDLDLPLPAPPLGPTADNPEGDPS